MPVNSTNPFIQEIQIHVETNLQNPEINIEQLCEVLNCSRSSLHRKITLATGMPPTKLIHAIRLERAKNLLKDCKINIAQIAYAVGYRDPNYFSRVFRKHFQISPKKYRKDNLGF